MLAVFFIFHQNVGKISVWNVGTFNCNSNGGHFVSINIYLADNLTFSLIKRLAFRFHHRRLALLIPISFSGHLVGIDIYLVDNFTISCNQKIGIHLRLVLLIPISIGGHLMGINIDLVELHSCILQLQPTSKETEIETTWVSL